MEYSVEKKSSKIGTYGIYAKNSIGKLFVISGYFSITSDIDDNEVLFSVPGITFDKRSITCISKNDTIIGNISTLNDTEDIVVWGKLAYKAGYNTIIPFTLVTIIK